MNQTDAGLFCKDNVDLTYEMVCAILNYLPVNDLASFRLTSVLANKTVLSLPKKHSKIAKLTTKIRYNELRMIPSPGYTYVVFILRGLEKSVRRIRVYDSTFLFGLTNIRGSNGLILNDIETYDKQKASS